MKCSYIPVYTTDKFPVPLEQLFFADAIRLAFMYSETYEESNIIWYKTETGNTAVNEYGDAFSLYPAKFLGAFSKYCKKGLEIYCVDGVNMGKDEIISLAFRLKRRLENKE